MAKILKGKEVADALTAKMQQDTLALKEAGITPTLCIFRVGERPDDLAYERGATKRAETVGIAVKKVILPADVSQEVFDETLQSVNEDDSIHGILLFRPLPGHLDNEKARQRRLHRSLSGRRFHEYKDRISALHSAGGHGNPAPLRHSDQRKKGGCHRPFPCHWPARGYDADA